MQVFNIAHKMTNAFKPQINVNMTPSVTYNFQPSFDRIDSRDNGNGVRYLKLPEPSLEKRNQGILV